MLPANGKCTTPTIYIMFVANPIYDVVFRFMMEDNKVAKKFVATIIGEDVVELDFKQDTYTIDISRAELKPKAKAKVLKKPKRESDDPGCLTVCRLDFVAKIRTGKDTFKTITIELQKAKLASDIMRFRRYLGRQYQDPENTSDVKKLQARQIYCIFLLNHSIGYHDHPVLEVDPQVKDTATGEILSRSDDDTDNFIDSLHHRSWIVQLPQLKERRRNDIEILLSVFSGDPMKHKIDLNEEDYPEEFRPIIRRLVTAYATPQMEEHMCTEDEIIAELRDKEREIAEAATAITVLKKKNTVLSKEKAVLSKEKAVLSKEKAVLADKNAVLSDENTKLKAKLAKMLHKQ
jgi:hypothetical protein